MMSRVMVSGMGSSRPGRWMVMLTLVPLGPRSFVTASWLVNAYVVSPSISMIWSPPWMPM